MFDYENMVIAYFREKKAQRIPNTRTDHAQYFIKHMFRNAAAEVRIFSGDFPDRFYGSSVVLPAIVSFISKPHTSLKILLQNAKDQTWFEGTRLGETLRNDLDVAGRAHGRVEVRNSVGNYTDNVNHFAVADDEALRFETHDEIKTAIANVCEPDTAIQLRSAFDEAIRFSQEKEDTLVYLMEPEWETMMMRRAAG